MKDAQMLRDIAAEIERYNHMKSAKWLNGLADRMDNTQNTIDELNFVLGLCIGVLSKRRVPVPIEIIEYLKTRGYIFKPSEAPDDGDKD